MQFLRVQRRCPLGHLSRVGQTADVAHDRAFIGFSRDHCGTLFFAAPFQAIHGRHIEASLVLFGGMAFDAGVEQYRADIALETHP